VKRAFSITDKELADIEKYISYDSKTGEFTRIRTKSIYHEYLIGTNPCKLKSNGYLEITSNNVIFKAHALAWYFVHGEYPKGKYQIDHIDHDKQNNAISNLRKVTASQNQRNRKLNKNNTSGFTGVVFHKPSDKWFSFIRLKPGTKKFLGSYENIEDAILARKEANVRYGFHINHGKK